MNEWISLCFLNVSQKVVSIFSVSFSFLHFFYEKKKSIRLDFFSLCYVYKSQINNWITMLNCTQNFPFFQIFLQVIVITIFCVCTLFREQISLQGMIVKIEDEERKHRDFKISDYILI